MSLPINSEVLKTFILIAPENLDMVKVSSEIGDSILSFICIRKYKDKDLKKKKKMDGILTSSIHRLFSFENLVKYYYI